MSSRLTATLGLALALLAGCGHAPPATSQVKEASWRSVVPPFTTEWPLVAPPPLRVSGLANGMTVYVVEMPTATTVAASLLSLAGSNVNPVDKQGLASLTWSALLTGAGGLGEAELAAQVDRLGTRVGSSVTANGASLNVVVQPQHTRRAVELLSMILRSPTFDQDAFALLREQVDSGLLQAEAQPLELSGRALLRELLGAGDRFARSAHGTRASVATIKRDDVRDFHRMWVAPNTMALVLVGRIDVAEARKLAQSVFGDWSGRGPLPPTQPLPVLHAGGPVQKIAYPGLNQARIELGRLGVPMGDPDEAPLEVLTVAINQQLEFDLRERKNLTYGVTTQSRGEQKLGLFTTGAWVRGDAITQALDAIVIQLRALARMQYRLARLHDIVAKSLVGRFDGVEGAVENARQAFFKQLPSDWLASYGQRVQMVSDEDLRRVIGRYLSPSELHVILLADPAQLQRLKYEWPPPAATPAK